MSTESYELYLSYNPDSDEASESFAFLSEVLRRQTKADKTLLNAIGAENVETRIALTNISHSSIHAFLTNVIGKTPNEEIRDKGLTAIWRQFLIDAKEIISRYASMHKKIEKPSDISDLKEEVVNKAQEHDLSSIGIESLSDEDFLEFVKGHNVPVEYLREKQTYKAIYGGREYTINRDFKVSDDDVEEQEKTMKNQQLYLRPKKIIYSGDSQWEFLTRGEVTIKANIEDKQWLGKFQNNLLPTKDYPFPTSVLSVIADITIKENKDGFQKSRHFTITKVNGVVKDLKEIEDAKHGLFE